MKHDFNTNELSNIEQIDVHELACVPLYIYTQMRDMHTQKLTKEYFTARKQGKHNWLTALPVPENSFADGPNRQ